jgi:hypothetical protein
MRYCTPDLGGFTTIRPNRNFRILEGHVAWRERKRPGLTKLKRSDRVSLRLSYALLIAPLRVVNVPCSVVPTVFTTKIIATAMPAAIRPYSMAVAPDLSFRKRVIRFTLDLRARAMTESW